MRVYSNCWEDNLEWLSCHLSYLWSVFENIFPDSILGHITLLLETYSLHKIRYCLCLPKIQYWLWNSFENISVFWFYPKSSISFVLLVLITSQVCISVHSLANCHQSVSNHLSSPILSTSLSILTCMWLFVQLYYWPWHIMNTCIKIYQNQAKAILLSTTNRVYTTFVLFPLPQDTWMCCLIIHC
jgi:hypothetical protein